MVNDRVRTTQLDKKLSSKYIQGSIRSDGAILKFVGWKGQSSVWMCVCVGGTIASDEFKLKFPEQSQAKKFPSWAELESFNFWAVIFFFDI